MSKLSDLFYQNADKYPDKLAIWCDGETATYQELSSLVSRYSNFLINHGVLYRDHIGIPMNNSIESVALIMAAADIGAGLVPINPTLPLSAIEAAFASGDVKHLIARKSFFEKLEKSGSTKQQGLSLCLDGEWEGVFSFDEVMGESVKRPICDRVTGDETLILTMTSGSTGIPKPIDLTQNNKLKRAFAHIELYGITKEDNILAATPLYHSLAERLVIIPLLIGATSVLLPRFTPILWLNCIKDQQVTFTIAVSAQLSQIAQLLSSPFVPEIDSLRCVVSSSALLEPYVRTQLIEKLQCDFHEMYGTSETSTATNINFKEALHKQKSVGRCIPEVDIRILRDNDDLADIGEIGEIACKTKLLFNGYYGLPDLTKQAFSDGYFKTGDLGCLDEDGYLYFCGRKKELIITGGINVYPNDIDQCIMRISDVAECAAFSYPDERLGEVVALAVVPQKDKKISKRAIQLHCAKHLADFQQPHYIFIVDELPKNAMGKLMRSKVIEHTRIHNDTQ